jgi:hypothetical protein
MSRRIQLVAPLAVVLGIASFPTSAAAPNQSLAVAEPKLERHPITLLAIANGAASGDRLCWQETPGWIEQVAAVEAQTAATHGTLEIPMDDARGYVACRPSPLDPVTYEETWITALRSHGMHVWFRQQWNSWSGGYGAPKRTYSSREAIPYETADGVNAVLDGRDTRSYLSRTYHYILAHPQFYANGDIFTPVGEPQDTGIGAAPCLCQFPSFAAMNRFLRDSITLDRYAFSQLGVSLLVGLDGTSCDYPDLEPATVAVMGIVGVDCYVPTPELMARDLAFVHNTYRAPIILSEWGAIYNDGQQPATAKAIASMMDTLLDAPYLRGIDYWQSYGGLAGDNVVDPTTLRISASGRALESWYTYALSLSGGHQQSGGPASSS